ncbi:MAG TPA: polyprenyl synthetase family protein [Nocardioides sp.]|nr:polyprenyl synthetase family protein [Nocardioides sp.]
MTRQHEVRRSASPDEALDRMLECGRRRAVATDLAHARLWDALADATEGGKRFRPALVVAAHDALGGDRPDAAAEVGAAIEMLHTAFVIHDDVIDGDDVRRGRLNVSGTFTSEALDAGAAPDDAVGLGRTAGILAGDLALAAAVRAVATCGAPSAVVGRLLDLVDAALHATAAGELADVWLALRSETPTLPESLVMEEQKTSIYSFSLPLQAGAVLAGASEATVATLGEAGRLLGGAFQLLDDLIGVFGDPARTGKSVTGDLRAQKQTPLLVHARGTAYADDVRRYVGRDLTEDELAEARRLLTVSGSRRFVEDLVESHLTAARTMLADLGVAVALVPGLATCFSILDSTEEVA